MSNKHDKDQRRKKKLREREEAKKRRTAIIRDGEKRTVYELQVDEAGPSLRSATAQVTKATRNQGSGGQPAAADDASGGYSDEPPF